jgi:hypothetical protein
MRVAVTADSNIARRGHSGTLSRTARMPAENGDRGVVPEPLTMSSEHLPEPGMPPRTSSLARNFIRRVVSACATRHILGIHVALLNFGHTQTPRGDTPASASNAPLDNVPLDNMSSENVPLDNVPPNNTPVVSLPAYIHATTDTLFGRQHTQGTVPVASLSGYDGILSTDIHSVVQNLFVGKQIVNTGCQSYSPVMSALTVALGDALNVIFEKHTNSCISLQSAGCCDEHLLFCRYEVSLFSI